jgi:riboflavin synthase alpha subunit
MELTITDAARVLADAYEGCSIAVNGVCLTVVTYTGKCAEGDSPQHKR